MKDCQTNFIFKIIQLVIGSVLWVDEFKLLNPLAKPYISKFQWVRSGRTKKWLGTGKNRVRLDWVIKLTGRPTPMCSPAPLVCLLILLLFPLRFCPNGKKLIIRELWSYNHSNHIQETIFEMWMNIQKISVYNIPKH